MCPVIKESNLENLKLHSKGKVREMYDLGDYFLMVASDRLSAFDVVFPDPIPNKGVVLNKLSIYWFNQTKHIIKNHFITDNVDEYPEITHQYREQLEGRSMLVEKTQPMPVECIARGYVVGSGWKEYQKTGMISGNKITEGLILAQKLPQSIYTPSTKAEEGHDINITYDESVKLVGDEIAQQLRKATLDLFDFAAKKLDEKGIILADTKFEFGMKDDELILIDEVVTPDSSRFWPKDKYSPGKNQESFDKQYVRDYLEKTSWDKKPPAPKLPDDIISGTSKKYAESLKLISGINI